MKTTLKKIAFLAGTFFLLIFVANLTEAAAQKTKKKAVTPNFSGAPDKAFKAFVMKNVGKRVSLKLTFTDENVPYGYRNENADPVFSVDSYSYFLECGEKNMESEWTTRCAKLNWNADTKTFSGFFKLTEPDPKNFRTNRMYYLTPTK